MVAEFLCRSPEATEAVGEALGARLGAGAVVGLVGPLGAGKTCFVRGLARGLGVQGGVSSPSFVLVNQYRGRLPVYHVDAYRAAGPAELLDVGLQELLEGPGVTVIEWAERVLPLLPREAIIVTIEGLGDEPRRIVIEEPARAGAPS